MTKTRDIVTAALRRIKVTAKTEDPTPNDSAFTLDRLNRMMFEWKAQGVDTSHTELGLNADFPLDVEFEGATIALLAQTVAPDYGKAVPSELRDEADTGWDVIQTITLQAPPAAVDDALLDMPSQREAD